MSLGEAPKHDNLFRSPVELCESKLSATSVYRLLAEQGHLLFADEAFSDLFDQVGRRSVPPRVVATVMVLQRIEGASDREAADRFAFDLRWKYAAGVDLDYRAFVHTVLVDMRARLRDSERPNRIFEATLEMAKTAGLLGRKRVLDSTALYDAVATQDTVTMIRSAIRGLLQQAEAEDAKLASALRGVLKRKDDYVAAGKPVCDWDDATAREALVDALSRDGHAALLQLHGSELSAPVKSAADLLATVLGQDLEQGEDKVFRIARRVSPDRVISTVDPDARHGHKTSARGFDGYKGHIAIDPDSEIITATEVTPGNVGDAVPAETLLRDVLESDDEAVGGDEPACDEPACDEPACNEPACNEPACNEPACNEPACNEPACNEPACNEPACNEPQPASAEPIEVYGDASYGTADLVETLEAANVDVYTKVQPPSGRGGKFSQDAFCIDLDARTVQCPAGQLVQLRLHRDDSGQAMFAGLCKECPLRAQCTDSKDGRSIKVHPKHRTLHRVRQRQRDPKWKERYRTIRPTVERKFGHLMRRRHGGRRARVRGRLRVGHDFALLAAAANLARLAALGVRFPQQVIHSQAR